METPQRFALAVTLLCSVTILSARDAAAPASAAPAAAGTSAPSASAAAPAAAKPVAATVNGVPIYESEVETALQQAQRSNQVAEDKVGDLRGVIVDQLIAVEVVTQAADKAGVKVADAEIDQMLAQLREQMGGDEAIHAASGLGIPEVKEQIARGLKAQHYLDQAVGEQAAVSDEDVKAFYDQSPVHFTEPEQARTSHILCMAPPSDADKRAAAKTRCEALLVRVQGGEDFATVAHEASDCPSKDQGGDLGWSPRGRMLPGFENAALALKEGEMTQALVETEMGYHIIKLTGRRPEKVRPLDDVKPQIRNFLVFNRQKEKEQAQVEALIAAAKIERPTPIPAPVSAPVPAPGPAPMNP